MTVEFIRISSKGESNISVEADYGIHEIYGESITM
jgi:hypothetical protein